MKIVVTQQKGGVGKSTISQIIICALDKVGKKFNYIDLDPQQSLSGCLEMSGLESSPEASYTIVDCPPSVFNGNTHEHLKDADRVIIPTTTSVHDVIVTKQTIPLIQELTRGDVKVVWNKFKKNTSSAKALDNLKKSLEVESYKTTIGARECYSQDFLIKGWSGLNKDAQEECFSFALEVIS